ncbi:MAG: HAMP domain-containing sensor histidine kinase [Methylorubrum populi]
MRRPRLPFPGRQLEPAAIATLPWHSAAPAATAEVRRARPLARLGLSGRLFLLTVAFVVLAEILIYVPAVATYRLSRLSDRVAAARVAALVLNAAPEGQVPDETARRLLMGAGARAIAVRVGETWRYLTDGPITPAVAETVDLRERGLTGSIGGAFRTLFFPAKAPIRAIGAGQDGFDAVEVRLDEAPLRTAVVDFSLRLLTACLVIAALAAALMFFVLQRAIVRPVVRLARDIAAFADDPERTDRVARRSARTDEIGEAETALARMQVALGGELRQRRRLAELGLSVSKINHELRNLLTTAQLLGDRLESVSDPLVQRIAPRLVETLDRAIRFCEATLAYGRATEPNPQRRMVALGPLLDELTDLADLMPAACIRVAVRAPRDLEIDVDPEQLLRALTNLVRNAVQAHAAAKTSDGAVLIEGFRSGPAGAGAVTILVTDNGPGVPERAKANLFAAFQGSTRAGGTGLGLAIASELVRLNGGTLNLDETPSGARFRIVIPDRAAGTKAA